MTEAAVHVEGDGRLATITLNDPRRLNALGHQTLSGLIAAAEELNTQKELQVVIVRGAGAVFTAGADVAAFDDDHEMTHEEADAGRVMAEAVEAIEAVTIAQIHGHCIGGGVVLAAACDLRIAAEGTSFSIPEIDLGIPLAWGGIPRMLRELGPARVKELVMTCRPFTAQEALALGFLNDVVPVDQLDHAVAALADVLLAKPRGPLVATKLHVNAVTRQMTGTDRSWADADALLAARHDPINRQAAADYLEQMRRK